MNKKIIPLFLSILILSLFAVILLNATWREPRFPPPYGNIHLSPPTTGDITDVYAGAGLCSHLVGIGSSIDVRAGDGIQARSSYLRTTLGTDIRGSEITDGTITRVDLAAGALPGPRIVQKLCGGRWHTLGPLESRGTNSVTVGGVRYVIKPNGLVHTRTYCPTTGAIVYSVTSIIRYANLGGRRRLYRPDICKCLGGTTHSRGTRWCFRLHAMLYPWCRFNRVRSLGWGPTLDWLRCTIPCTDLRW